MNDDVGDSIVFVADHFKVYRRRISQLFESKYKFSKHNFSLNLDLIDFYSNGFWFPLNST